MLPKIADLRKHRGLGIFANRSPSAPSLEFRQYNLIYGFNGSGKSTLSRLFACLEAGELHPKLPVSCSFEVAMDDGTTYAFPDKLDGLQRRVMVFNTDFIDTNLEWTQGRARPVFFIGADQREAAAKLSEIETRLPELKQSVTTSEAAEKLTERTLTIFKRERARLTASKLHQGNRKYEAPQLTDDYEQWHSSTDLRILDEDQLRAAEDTRRLEAPMPKVAPLQFDAQTIAKAYRFVRKTCEQTISDVSLKEIQDFPDMLLWLKEGHKFHERQTLSQCLLCGSDFSQARKERLKAAFDNQIDEFIARLRQIDERLQNVRSSLRLLEQNLPMSDAFSTELKSQYREHRMKLADGLKLANHHLDALGSVLRTKMERPARAADTSKLASPREVDDASAAVDQAVKAVNLLIEQHNQVVSDFVAHREAAGIAIRKHFIAQCGDEFSAHVEALADAKRKVAAAREGLERARTEADDLRQKIKTHGPAADVINKLIASYLGHGELTIKSIDDGYELHRHGRTIEGAPSEGEKTAIAISYFLSRLEAEGRKLKDLIVVFDDPISSLDTKALNYACSLIRSRVSGACQVFVLTHNQQCLNEFRKNWKNKARPPDDKPPTATFLFIDVSLPKGQTKRVATLVEMSKLLREYDSEYHFLFSHVLKFSQASDYSDYGYMMPNVLRRVLDVFLAFKCPGGSGLTGKIEEICKHYPHLDKDRLSALERLSQVESHSDNLDDLVSFSSMTLEETRLATEALLNLMDQVDEKHTSSLRKICA